MIYISLEQVFLCWLTVISIIIVSLSLQVNISEHILDLSGSLPLTLVVNDGSDYSLKKSRIAALFSSLTLLVLVSMMITLSGSIQTKLRRSSSAYTQHKYGLVKLTSRAKEQAKAISDNKPSLNITVLKNIIVSTKWLKTNGPVKFSKFV